MVFFTTFHFVDPDLIFLRGVPVSLLSSMPFFNASRPRISAASIALWVVSPADSNSNSIMAVIFIGVWSYSGVVSSDREGVGQIFACIGSYATGVLVFAGPTGKLTRVFLEVRTLLPALVHLVSTLKSPST